MKRHNSTRHALIRVTQATLIDVAFVLWFLAGLMYVAFPWLFSIAGRAKSIVDNQTALLQTVVDNPLAAPPISGTAALQTEFALVGWTALALIVVLVCALCCSAAKSSLLYGPKFKLKQYLILQGVLLSGLFIVALLMWYIYRSLIFSVVGVIVVPAVAVALFFIVLIGVGLRWYVLVKHRVFKTSWQFFAALSVGTLVVLILALNNPLLFAVATACTIVFGNALKITLIKPFS